MFILKRRQRVCPESAFSCRYTHAVGLFPFGKGEGGYQKFQGGHAHEPHQNGTQNVRELTEAVMRCAELP